MNTESRDLEAENSYEALPQRRETMLALDQHVTGISQQTRTQIHGVEKVWQPSAFLPDFSQQENAILKVKELQAQARTLPPELLAVLIGDAVTEEGLPTFTSRLFTTYGLPSGSESDVHVHQGNLQEWYRQWTAEEHRHGVLLNTWLRLSGRVDMDSYERTVHLFLNDGMDIKIGNDPYRAFVYTSFQELATQRSHANVAKLAKDCGNHWLAKICGQIAADEGYHAKAYIEFVRFIFEKDPNGMMKAFADMMQRGIVMPAHTMREVDKTGTILQPGETYRKFSDAAQHIGVYTSKDYAEIGAQILTAWKVGERNVSGWAALPMDGLQEDGQEAQKDILKKQRVAEKFASRPPKKDLHEQHDFSWLIPETGK